MEWNSIIDTKEGLRLMLGQTFVRVKGAVGDHEMIFETTNGERFVFTHFQDCCESVDINDIVGDLQDLVGEPLLVAEEVQGEVPADFEDEYTESYTFTFYKFATRRGYVEGKGIGLGVHTFTFYKFATRRGYVDVRWLGESNGYYSESVDLCHIKG